MNVAVAAAEADGRFDAIDPAERAAARRRLRLRQIEQRWNTNGFAADRDAILHTMADELAGQDLPDQVRDAVNRMRLARERELLRAAEPTERNAARLSELDAWADRLTVAERWAAHLPGHPPVRLLAFPRPGEPGGPMLAVGDVSSARELLVQVADAAVPVPVTDEDGFPIADPDLALVMNDLTPTFSSESAAAVLTYPGADTVLVEQLADLVATRDESAGPPAAVRLSAVGTRARNIARGASQMSGPGGPVPVLVSVVDATPGVRAEVPPPHPHISLLEPDGTRWRKVPANPDSVVSIALEWAGIRDIRDLLAPPDADLDEVRRLAAANNRAWRTWPPYVHRILVELYAEVLAEAPGLPTAVRDKARRSAPGSDWTPRGTEEEKQWASRSLETFMALWAADTHLENWGGVPVQALSKFVGDDTWGMTVAFGDPDTAQRVYWGCSMSRA